MFKFKTSKLLAVSLLSVFVTQALAEDIPPAADDVQASAPQTTNSGRVDFSSPTAIYSKVGLATGTEGVDVYASLNSSLGGSLDQKLTFEVMHDADYFNINYLAFNSSNNTGFLVNTTWGDDPDYDKHDNYEYSEVSVGIIKKLQSENERMTFYPAMKLGVMWDWDNSILTTTFVELDVAVRYMVTSDFWVGITPTYRYALNGLDIDDLDGSAVAGYQLADQVAVSAHINNDDEVWADFIFTF